MSPSTPLERLKRLYAKLDGEGWHVDANTVALAIEAIEAQAVLLNEAYVAMRLAWALPLVSEEYDFAPVLERLQPFVGTGEAPTLQDSEA